MTETLESTILSPNNGLGQPAPAPSAEAPAPQAGRDPNWASPYAHGNGGANGHQPISDRYEAAVYRPGQGYVQQVSTSETAGAVDPTPAATDAGNRAADAHDHNAFLEPVQNLFPNSMA
jgi:hypothetical protein